VVEDLSLVVK